MDEEIKRVSCW